MSKVDCRATEDDTQGQSLALHVHMKQTQTQTHNLRTKLLELLEK